MQRSPAMRKLLETLHQMERSQAWLGRQLDPPVSRQTISGYWRDVPEAYVEQVARAVLATPCSIRPDLPKFKKLCQRAA